MRDETGFCGDGIIHQDVVAKVSAAMPSAGSLYRLANLYKMFADITRLKILSALACESMCVCDLAALIGTTKSATSHQLKSLRLSNLVKYERRGKIVYYSLADSHLKEIFEKGFEHISE